MTRFLSIAVLLAACGGKQSTPAATPAPTTAHEEHGEMHMSPELKTFHDVLAPRWHAEKGAKRMQDTCAALPDFHSDADALAKATPPPNSHADVWTTGTKRLVDAVAGLDATCKANDASQFETAFEKVHVSFHGLLEASGGEHEGEHGEHME
jgi:membrane-bound lytic murein transglycosylase B